MTSELSQGTMSRRTLLMGAAMSSAWQAFARETSEASTAANPEKLKICVFSKHLQWTSISDAASIARDIGFDGIDITVRAEGHVLPERVATDLPAAVEAVH